MFRRSLKNSVHACWKLGECWKAVWTVYGTPRVCSWSRARRDRLRIIGASPPKCCSPCFCWLDSRVAGARGRKLVAWEPAAMLAPASGERSREIPSVGIATWEDAQARLFLQICWKNHPSRYLLEQHRQPPWPPLINSDFIPGTDYSRGISRYSFANRQRSIYIVQFCVFRLFQFQLFQLPVFRRVRRWRSFWY